MPFPMADVQECKATRAPGRPPGRPPDDYPDGKGDHASEPPLPEEASVGQRFHDVRPEKASWVVAGRCGGAGGATGSSVAIIAAGV